MRLRPLLFVAMGCLAACGTASSTSSPSSPLPSASSQVSATPQVVGSQRTVLTPLGLNIHSDPSATAAVVATAAQGVALTVLDYRPDNGGWFKVMGQSTTGWIVSDPALTGMGTFTSYSSDSRMFSVLVPSAWTFIEETNDVVFRPAQGQQSIVVRNAATLAALGQEAPGGFASSFSEQEIVCGYTGALDEYVRSGGVSATSTASPASSAQHLANYAAIRLTFDAKHAIELAFNYESKDQLAVFREFFDSITFPFQLCQAQPSPSPT